MVAIAALIAAVVWGLAVLCSIPFLYAGAMGARRWFVFEYVDPTPVADVTPGSVKVAGVAVPPDGGTTVEAPVSGEECLYGSVELVGQRTTGRSGRYRGTTRIGGGFDLRDDTGRIRVDAGNGHAVVERSGEASVETDEVPPAYRPARGGPVEIRQDVVRPGDEVVVAGTARERSGAVDPPMTLGIYGFFEDFLITDEGAGSRQSLAKPLLLLLVTLGFLVASTPVLVLVVVLAA